MTQLKARILHVREDATSIKNEYVSRNAGTIAKIEKLRYKTFCQSILMLLNVSSSPQTWPMRVLQ